MRVQGRSCLKDFASGTVDAFSGSPRNAGVGFLLMGPKVILLGKGFSTSLVIAMMSVGISLRSKDRLRCLNGCETASDVVFIDAFEVRGEWATENMIWTFYVHK